MSGLGLFCVLVCVYVSVSFTIIFRTTGRIKRPEYNCTSLNGGHTWGTQMYEFYQTLRIILEGFEENTKTNNEGKCTVGLRI